MKRKVDWMGVAVHVGALAPLGVLLARWALGRLTFDPVRAAILSTGRTALTLLVLSLACTPMRVLTGWQEIARARRPLGLYGFGYAALHLTLFAGVDYGLDLRLLWAEIAGKRFIQAGLAAFLLLLPLALTSRRQESSTQGWMLRLGWWWRPLHRLAYVAVSLAVLHWLWLIKVNRPWPWIYGAVVLMLLALRLPLVRKRLVRWRRKDSLPPCG